MDRIRIGAGLLLVALGVGGAAEVSAYLRTGPQVAAMALVFAGVVVLVRMAVPAPVPAGPYLVGALGTVALLTGSEVVGWERVASVAPLALVAGGLAVTAASVVTAVGSRRAAARARP